MGNIGPLIIRLVDMADLNIKVKVSFSFCLGAQCYKGDIYVHAALRRERLPDGTARLEPASQEGAAQGPPAEARRRAPHLSRLEQNF